MPANFAQKPGLQRVVDVLVEIKGKNMTDAGQIVAKQHALLGMLEGVIVNRVEAGPACTELIAMHGHLTDLFADTYALIVVLLAGGPEDEAKVKRIADEVLECAVTLQKMAVKEVQKDDEATIIQEEKYAGPQER